MSKQINTSFLKNSVFFKMEFFPKNFFNCRHKKYQFRHKIYFNITSDNSVYTSPLNTPVQELLPSKMKEIKSSKL